MILISWMAPPLACLTQLQVLYRGLGRFPVQCWTQQIHPDLSLLCTLDMHVSTAAYRCHASSCLRVCVSDIPPVEMPFLSLLAFLNLPIFLMSDFVYFILLQIHSSLWCGNMCTRLASDNLAFNGFWHCGALGLNYITTLRLSIPIYEMGLIRLCCFYL